MRSTLYTPDLWTLLEITNPSGERHFRVLASWYGGYLGSDSWRMSSGITKIELAEGEYRIHNESGSVYSCRSGAEGMSGFASSVLRRYQDDVAALGVTIRQLEKIESGPLPIHTALMKQLGDFVEVVQVASSERLPPDEEDSRGLRL